MKYNDVTLKDVDPVFIVKYKACGLEEEYKKSFSKKEDLIKFINELDPYTYSLIGCYGKVSYEIDYGE